MSLFLGRRALLCALLLGFSSLGCGSDGAAASAEPDASLPTYAFDVAGAFTDDGMGLPFVAQNGAVIHIPAEDVRGKELVYIVTEAGETAPNAKFLALGTTEIAADLTFSFKTEPKFHDGPWELTVFALIEGTDFTKGPQMGDIAAYSPLDTKVPEGEPPTTGVSVRVRVDGKDAKVMLDNSYFVRF